MLPAALRGAESQQERGRRVIHECIQALGGDAFRQMPGILETGKAFRFYNDNLTGLGPAKIYTKYLIEPAAGQTLREVQRQVLGRNDDETVLLSGKEGWDVTYRGAEEIPAERMEQFRETTLTNIFYILRARLDEPNATLFAQGADVVENQPVEVVDYYDAENRNVRFWIHSSTWLPVRQLVKRWDPAIKDRREEMTHFTKYREAGNGVMWPHETERDRDGEKVYQLIADSAKVGVFNDGMFELPGNVKILKRNPPPEAVKAAGR